MHARTLFLVLSFFLLLALPAQAQPPSPQKLDGFAEQAKKPEADGFSQYSELEQASPVELPSPIALSLGIVVLLCTLPFAIHYFGDMSREMRAAQKTNSSPKKAPPRQLRK